MIRIDETIEHPDITLVCAELRARGWNVVSCDTLDSMRTSEMRTNRIHLVLTWRCVEPNLFTSPSDMEPRVEASLVAILPLSTQLTCLQYHQMVKRMEGIKEDVIRRIQLPADILALGVTLSTASFSIQLAYLDSDGRALLLTAFTGIHPVEDKKRFERHK
ncbi:unnamed protein product [Dicrocoelium dendriticum]|nr:unnamed protein product [Dicrocoelium dendriticum]